MIFFVLIAFVLALFLPDMYIYCVYLRRTATVWQVLHWAPAVLMAASLVYILVTLRRGGVVNMQMGAVLLAAMLCFGLPKLVFTLCSLLGRAGAWLWPQATGVLQLVGVSLGVWVALVMAYGLTIGWREVAVKHVDLCFDNLPEAFDGYKIAQLSDLHVGTYLHAPDVLNKIVDGTNAERPDLIVFTGDIVNTSADELPPVMETLSRLHAPDGVLSVLGNHDYCMPGRDSVGSHIGQMDVIMDEMQMGWRVLLNDHHVIHRGADSIAIIGVQNTGKPPFPQVGDLRKAMQGVASYDGQQSPDMFAVLLSHDPSHWRMEVLPKTTIPLTLSGHTHAGQLKIGSWSLSQYQYPEWGGLYEESTASNAPQASPRYLYVSEGTGGSFPFRLGTRPEIVIITLHRK